MAIAVAWDAEHPDWHSGRDEDRSITQAHCVLAPDSGADHGRPGRNLHGNVHGGVIMKAVDDAAGACAARHCRAPAVTAAMDEMVFVEPVRVGDILTTRAQVNLGGSDIDGGRRAGDRPALG